MTAPIATMLRAEPALRPPAEVRPLVTLIGSAATLRLVELHGGTRIKVPSQARAQSALGRDIGPDALAALVTALGGNTLKIPLCKAWRARVLRRRDGLTYSEIARTLGTTETVVHRYLAEANLTNQGRLPGL